MPISLNVWIILSVNFKYSIDYNISPVNYKLWNRVSTRSSIFSNNARSLGSFTFNCWAKNFSFNSTTSHTSSFSIIWNNFSSIFSNKSTAFLSSNSISSSEQKESFVLLPSSSFSASCNFYIFSFWADPTLIIFIFFGALGFFKTSVD